MKSEFRRRLCGAVALPLALAVAACAHEHEHATVASSPTACEVAAAPGNALVRAPFEIVGGRVYVQARVNGVGPYRFAVDTGASGMGRADASLTAALGLTVNGAQQSSDGVSTSAANTVHLDSIALDGLRRDNLDVITRDYSSSVPPEAAISGILGRDFFGDGLLVIDFPNHMLTFSRGPALSSENAGALSYERAFRVPVRIGDLETTANLDTGAAVQLVLPKAVYDQVAASPLEAAGRGRLTNGAIDTSRAVVHGPLLVGGINVSDVETRVAEQYPEVLIGGGILQHYRIAFDQRSHLVAVCAP